MMPPRFFPVSDECLERRAANRPERRARHEVQVVNGKFPNTKEALERVAQSVEEILQLGRLRRVSPVAGPARVSAGKREPEGSPIMASIADHVAARFRAIRLGSGAPSHRAVQASSRYSETWMFSQMPRCAIDSARADRRLPASISRAGISLRRRGT